MPTSLGRGKGGTVSTMCRPLLRDRGSATAAQPCGPPQERAAWRFSAWLQVYWPRPRDDLLEGQRQLRLRALALRAARGDEQHDQMVRAVTADSRVLARAVAQRVVAALVDVAQAGP